MRRALLARPRARNLCLKILEEVRSRFQSRVVGYMLVPEHVHLLIGEPQRGTVAILIQVLKQRVSRRMRGKRRLQPKEQLSLTFANARESIATLVRWLPSRNGKKKKKDGPPAGTAGYEYALEVDQTSFIKEGSPHGAKMPCVPNPAALS